MDLWIETLLKSKEGLHSLHPSAIEWADKEGVLYAFNTAGDLLAVRNKQIFFTKEIGRASCRERVFRAV